MPSSAGRTETGAFTWASQNPLSVVTLLGGVIYVFVFESYRATLLPLGLTPSEVGIGYTDVVWPVAQVTAYLILLLLVVFYVLARSRRLRDLRPQQFVPPSAVLIVVALTLLAVMEMTAYQHSLATGNAYDPVFRSRLQVLPALRANRVNIAWTESGTVRPPLPIDEVLFLGSTATVAVFYVHKSEQTIRVPAIDIVVTEAKHPQ